MTSAPTLTPTDLIAASVDVLKRGNYSEYQLADQEWNSPYRRLFENEYNIVGIAAFSTCGDLISSWWDLQGSLVDLISSKVGHVEAKSWDGYLVLLTGSIAPTEQSRIEQIRYNTKRLRKLVATGDILISSGDVERVLRPLLPLHLEATDVEKGTALDRLAIVLSEHGIDVDIAKTLVDCFINQESMIETIHQQRSSP